MRLLILLLCITITGCATGVQSKIGSKNWYEYKIEQLTESYQRGEITKAQYFELSNEIDNTYLQHRDAVLSRLR